MYAGDRHASLQNADAALVQLKGFITSLYLELGPFKDVAPTTRVQLALDVDDAYWNNQDVTFTVTPSRPGSQVLRAVIENCADSAVRDAVGLLATSTGMVRARLKPLEPGVYRLRVTGKSPVDPVSDVFTVFDRATA